MKNNKGFSLIEILIAIGLLTGLTVWMMHLFKQQTKNEKSAATNIDIDAIGLEIRNILGDGLSCEKTFKGLPPTKSAGTEFILKVLSDGSDQKRYAVGTKANSNTGVAIAAYDLKQDETYFVPQGKQIGETVLHISYNRGTNVHGGQFKDFKIPLSVTLDPSGNIQTCHALASTTNLASICNAIGRSVDTNNKKCDPPSVFIKGDVSIYFKQYGHCQGGSGSGEHILADWTATGTGSVRLTWTGVANDNSVAWKVYKNNAVVYSGSASGFSSDSETKDIDIVKGDIIKHTVTLSGGVDNDCLTAGSFMIGLDLLNMM